MNRNICKYIRQYYDRHGKEALFRACHNVCLFEKETEQKEDDDCETDEQSHTKKRRENIRFFIQEVTANQ